jgi:hypothetical protein
VRCWSIGWLVGPLPEVICSDTLLFFFAGYLSSENEKQVEFRDLSLFG